MILYYWIQDSPEVSHYNRNCYVVILFNSHNISDVYLQSKIILQHVLCSSCKFNKLKIVGNKHYFSCNINISNFLTTSIKETFTAVTYLLVIYTEVCMFACAGVHTQGRQLHCSLAYVNMLRKNNMTMEQLFVSFFNGLGK